MKQDELLNDLLETVKERRKTFAGSNINVALIRSKLENLALYYLSIVFTGKTEMLSESRRYEYENLVVARIPQDIESTNQFIERLLKDNSFELPELPVIKTNAGLHNVSAISSRESFGWIESSWPGKYYKGSIANVSEGDWSHPVSAQGQPLYPDLFAAISGLLELRWQRNYQRIPSDVEILVPDYRARITALRIRNSGVALQAEGGEQDLSETRAKFFVSAERGPSTSKEISFENNLAEFEVGDRPLEVYTELVHSTDGSTIDSRRFNYRGYVRDDVHYDDLALELTDMIKGGENENVEFKLQYNGTAPHEILESVVSFANTDGGIIIIGVDDNGNIKGVERDITQSIRGKISDLCDPPPRVEIGIQEIETEERIIVYIRIHKGDNPPYSLIGHGVYIRHGSSDMQAKRVELDRLYKKDNW